MDIQKHPIWSDIKSYKKLAHLLRFFVAKRLSSFYPRSMFVGITGSVGKTTTTKACVSVLSQKMNVVSTSEDLDTIFNLPITILKIRPAVKKVILEMGVRIPGEMEFYLSLVRPATGIITKISFSHNELLGSVENVIDEKSLLIRQLPKDGFAILNWDDLNTRKLAEQTQAQVIFFGTDPKRCDIWAGNIRLEGNLTVFELNHGVERVEVYFKLLGRHFIYPALAAAALGVVNGLSLMNIKRGLEEVVAADHRLQLLEGTGGWIVLDDTYNSSPSALEEVLNVVAELPARKRILVLGEMRELGSFSEKLHRKIAQKIYNDKIADLIFLGGGDTRFIGNELLKLGFPANRLEVGLTNPQIVSKVLQSVAGGDLVLVKGSRAVKLDEVVKRISKHTK